MREPLPLARIHDAVLAFLRGRDDAVLSGAQAVNAYVDEPRMTQDVNILSPRAQALAEELRAHLGKTFHIAVRVRVVADGKGYRVFQLREPKNRHLADVRQIEAFPPTKWVDEVRVLTPDELIAQKVISYTARRGQPKSGTDWRDVAMLLQAYPQLKQPQGAVHDRLLAASANAATLSAWKELANLDLRAESDDDLGY